MNQSMKRTCLVSYFYRDIYEKNPHEFFFCNFNFRSMVHTSCINTCSVHKHSLLLLTLNSRILQENDPLHNFHCIVYTTDGAREASSVSGEDDSSYCEALLKDTINKNDDETLLQSRPFSTDRGALSINDSYAERDRQGCTGYVFQRYKGRIQNQCKNNTKLRRRNVLHPLSNKILCLENMSRPWVVLVLFQVG